MPSSMTDFINTFLNLKQVQNQTEQIAQKAKQDAIMGVNTFMEIAQHTADPMQLTGLVQRFSDLGVASAPELTAMLAHVTPTQDALKAHMVQRGIIQADGNTIGPTTPEASNLARETANVALTGHDAGQLAGSSFLDSVFKKVDSSGTFGDQLAAGLASRTATGMTPYDMTVDAAGRALPPAEILQQAGVKGGTRMSAAQDANNQATWAGIRSTERRNTNEAAFQVGSLMNDAAKARAVAAGKDPQIIDNLIQAKTQLMSSLTAAKSKNPSAQELLAFIGGLNSINQQMAAYGLPNEGQIDYKPEDLVQPGAIQTILNKFAPQKTSVPVNKQPVGTGRR